MNNNEWKKVCAACAEGTPPERCAYYGDPDGCNAPTLGKHPEGDLAERLQGELEKAERRIAELERASGDAAAMRESIETMRRYAMIPQEQLSLSLLQRTIHEKCDAALSAPARNCDRFKNAEEAEEAFVKFCGFAMNGKIPYWKCPPNCGHTGPDGWVTCCIRWLFATAKGGDHA